MNKDGIMLSEIQKLFLKKASKKSVSSPVFSIVWVDFLQYFSSYTKSFRVFFNFSKFLWKHSTSLCKFSRKFGICGNQSFVSSQRLGQLGLGWVSFFSKKWKPTSGVLQHRSCSSAHTCMVIRA